MNWFFVLLLATAFTTQASLTPIRISAPKIDILKYNLHLTFPEEFKTSVSGSLDISFKTLISDTKSIDLDSADLDIHTIILKSINKKSINKSLRFEVLQNNLHIELDTTLNQNDNALINIVYKKTKSFDRGMVGLTDKNDNLEWIYTQSEPEDSMFWFPSLASPNDRALFESWIETPRGLKAISNGDLIETKLLPSGKSQFHYKMNEPMASYLFMVAVGDFWGSQRKWNGIPINFYGPKNLASEIDNGLKNTIPILEWFGKATGLKYPYTTYSQVVIPGFTGGMENVTATVLSPSAARLNDEQYQENGDYLIVHEMAHQWFGNWVTSKSWDHIWLNEGITDYFTTLFLGAHTGPDYEFESRLSFKESIQLTDEIYLRPIVYKYINSNILELFNEHAYKKGAWVIHMLKQTLGDRKFFKGINYYLKKHALKLVDTSDFQIAMEEASGISLTSFFDQWVLKPGMPDFEFSYSYSPSNQSVILKINQNQSTKKVSNESGAIPYFSGPLNFDLGGTLYKVQLTAIQSQTIILNNIHKAPRYIAIDPNLDWLAKFKSVQSTRSWIAELSESPYRAARYFAAEHLGSLPVSESELKIDAASTLVFCASNDQSPWVRATCIKNVAKLVANDPILIQRFIVPRLKTWINPNNSSWKVIVAVAQALGILTNYSESKVYLESILKEDPLIEIKLATIQSIGKQKGDWAWNHLVNELNPIKYKKRVNLTILGAMIELGDPRGFEVAEAYWKDRDQSIDVRIYSVILMTILSDKYSDLFSDRFRINLELGLFDKNPDIIGTSLGTLYSIKKPASIPALNAFIERVGPTSDLGKRAKEVIEHIITCQETSCK